MASMKHDLPPVNLKGFAPNPVTSANAIYWTQHIVLWRSIKKSAPKE